MYLFKQSRSAEEAEILETIHLFPHIDQSKDDLISFHSNKNEILSNLEELHIQM